MGLEFPASGSKSAIVDAFRAGLCKAFDGIVDFGDAIFYQSATADFYDATRRFQPAVIGKGLFCDSFAPPIPPLSNLPKGGQCNGVRYRVFGYLTDNETNPSRQRKLKFEKTVWGPITGVSPIVVGGSTITGYNLICRGDGANPIAPAGTLVNVGAGDGSGGVVGINIQRIEPLDGASDNCGTIDFDPKPIPPEGIEIDIGPQLVVNADPTLNFFFNGVVTIFNPQIDNNFDIQIPLNLKTDINIGNGFKFEVNATANLNTGDIKINFFPPGETSPRGNNDDDTLAPVRPPQLPPGNANPPPPDEDKNPKSRIVGVQVKCVTTALQRKATIIGQAENPDIYAPGLGYIQFFIDDAAGRDLGWTTDIPVKNVYQYIPCPVPEGAKAVTGTPNPGVEWVLTPVTKSISI